MMSGIRRAGITEVGTSSFSSTRENACKRDSITTLVPDTAVRIRDLIAQNQLMLLSSKL